MAVETVSGPTVQQSGAPISPAASPEAFGAGVAAGLGRLGETEQQTSDTLAQHAEQFQALNNKAEADTAWTANLKQANTAYDQYVTNNLGGKALPALPGLMKSLDDTRSSIGDTLSNPMARAMYDQESRRQMANITGEASRFAATQQKQYILDTSKAKMEALVSDIALHPGNADANLKGIITEQAFQDDQNGVSADVGQLNVRKVIGNAVGFVSKAMTDNGDVKGAMAFLEKYKGQMDGGEYVKALSAIAPAFTANQAHDIGAAAASDALSGASNFGGKVRAGENGPSGTNIGKNPNSSAAGYDQFLGHVENGQGKGTFFGVLKAHPDQFPEAQGKTPEQQLQLRNDSGFMARMTNVYAQDNGAYLQSKGLPATDANLGLAHRFGPGGAEALLHADPNASASSVLGAAVTKANPTLAKLNVAQVINQFQTQFGTATNSTDIGAAYGRGEALARAAAERIRPGDSVFADNAASIAHHQLDLQYGATKASESNVASQLISGVLAGATDLDSLNKAIPGAYSMYASLPGQEQRVIDQAMISKSNEMPPSAWPIYDNVRGAYALAKNGEQSDFFTMSFAGLPPKLQSDFYAKRADLLAKQGKEDASDSVFTHAWRSPEITAELPNVAGANWNKPGNPATNRMAGILHGAIDAWIATNKKPPSDKELTKDIYPQVWAQASRSGALTDVTSSRYVTAIEGLKELDVNSPNEQDIGRQMEMDYMRAVAQLQRQSLPVTPEYISKMLDAVYQHRVSPHGR